MKALPVLSRVSRLLRRLRPASPTRAVRVPPFTPATQAAPPMPKSVALVLVELDRAPDRLRALAASPEVVAHAERLAAEAARVAVRRRGTPQTLRLHELADASASLVALHRSPR